MPVDLAARIGAPGAIAPVAAAEPVRRLDGPIESDRAARRAMLIGANEPLPDRLLVLGVGETIVPRASASAAIAGRPTMIGLEETVAVQPAVAALPEPEAAAPVAPSVAPGHREAPHVGEMDLVVTPLATPDEWHHFELALRRVPGVGPLRIEYYRAGILKLRLAWSGVDRFATAVARTPGYRVGILGEDRSTVQIRVVRA